MDRCCRNVLVEGQSVTKQQIFLHIGTNKTGTSSIQHHFFQNRDLLSQNDLCYPALGANVAAHHNVAKWVKSPKKFEAELNALKTEIAPFKKVVLSSEAFCDLDDPHAVEQQFPECDVKVILYLRDPVRYFLSWWQQDIQMGKRYPDMRSYLMTQRRSYAGLVDKWVEVFGRSNLIIRVYDRTTLPKGDVLLDFKKITGTDTIQGMQRLPWDNNPSISGNLLYFKLIYNTLGLPSATSQSMIDGLTDTAKLDGSFRIVPFVPSIVCDVTKYHYLSELQYLKKQFGIRIPVSAAIDGVRIPELDTIRRDFRTVMEFSEEKGLPLAEMAKYVKF